MLRAIAAKAAIAQSTSSSERRGGELRADARLAHRHDRVGERDGVDAVLEQRRRRRRRAVRVAEHHRDDWMIARRRRRSQAPPAPGGNASCERTGALAARHPRPPGDRARRGWRRRSAAPGCWRRGRVATADAGASMASRRPLVKPPLAPPSALPSVPVIRSTRSATPWSAGVPRPSGPTKPTACESSTMTSASYSSASSQMRSQRRDVPIHREHAVGGDHAPARVRRLAEALLELVDVAIARSAVCAPCRAAHRR